MYRPIKLSQERMIMTDNIDNFAQEINTCVCNCGRLTEWYPEKGYQEFWVQDPDSDDYLLYPIDDIPSDDPYEAIERYIDEGTFGYYGATFDGSPIFILATMQGGE